MIIPHFHTLSVLIGYDILIIIEIMTVHAAVSRNSYFLKLEINHYEAYLM
jgi:hypothetical protein